MGQVLAKWAKDAQVEGDFAPHCLRRGGLMWAHQAKISGEALQIMGDWHSQAYLRYIDLDFDSRVQTGQRMADMVPHFQ